MKAVLRINGLTIKTKRHKTDVLLVHNLSMSVGKGQITALAGESGSGKSMTAAAVAQLLPPQITAAGSIILDTTELTALSRKELNRIRAREMSIIFQEPVRALNPLIPVGKQVEEVLCIHTGLTRQERKAQVLGIFKETGISEPERVYHAYPHQLSGGMNQRIMIAVATILKPKLLIADEPTTALDVTVQKQIITLLKRLRERNGTSVLLITHDLALAAEVCDFIYVMYAGHIVESGSVQQVFTAPQHPYTKALLQTIPRAEVKADRLYPIEGSPPEPAAAVESCLFYPRCTERSEECRTAPVPLYTCGEDRAVRCIRCKEAVK